MISEEDLLKEELSALHEGIRKSTADAWQLRTLAFGFLLAAVSISDTPKCQPLLYAALIATIFLLYAFDVLFHELLARQSTRRNEVRDALVNNKPILPFADLDKPPYRPTWKKKLRMIFTSRDAYRLIWYGSVVLIVLFVLLSK